MKTFFFSRKICFLVFFLLLFENASARLFVWLLFCSASVPHKSIKWYEISNLVLLLCSALFFTRRALWARTKLLINVFFILRWIFMKTMSFIHMSVCQREMAFNCNLNLSWAELNIYLVAKKRSKKSMSCKREKTFFMPSFLHATF